jgi:hypothetical protein
MSHRLITFIPFILCIAFTPAELHAGIDPVNNERGVALHGHDAVAYFKEGKPVKGRDAIVAEWMGVKWLFSKEEHRDLFVAEPEKYAPQFGGYCAWAVSHGYVADIDPEAWSIVNGKLYVNYSKEVRAMWDKEKEKLIPLGEKNWITLRQQ